MTGGNPQPPTPNSQGDAGDFCRQVEAYLCRKNDGHLIRIAGPAFEQVCGWATRGIPLALVTRGIDRYFDRYYAKGPRRRPIRIEFCEADVLDVFDEWRRSVGVSTVEPSGGTSTDSGAEPGSRGSESLPAHLERVIARLTTLRGGVDRSLDAALDATVRELDTMRAQAKSARGDRRDELVERLRGLDAALLGAVRNGCAAEVLRELDQQADEELRPFRARLSPEAYRHAHGVCIERLLRDHARLPALSYA